MSKYFTEQELKCRCGKCDGSIGLLNPAFTAKLELFREKYGAPMIVTSCIRCKLHPIEAAKINKGAHAYGCAIDIQCKTSQERFKMMKILMDIWVTRIGYADTFIHFDMADQLKIPGFPQNVLWDYNK